LLGAAADPRRISAAALALLEHPKHELLFSAANIWEVSIELSLGREDFRVDPQVLRRGLIDHGHLELAATSEHAVAVMTLPPLHRDPFDRILVAQSSVEGALLLTADPLVAQYPGPIRLV